MPAVLAAGGVLWRPAGSSLEVALVHRPRYGDWSLPKGKLLPGEDPLLGALREVHEETGFEAVAGARAGTSRYDVLVDDRLVPKAVHWWALRAGHGRFAPSEEVDELRWCSPAGAEALLTSGRDLLPLRQAVAGAALQTVLLVRHGSAGDRRGFDGPDDARPLDAKGVRQAGLLAARLTAYGVVRVVSAPPVRCRQTLTPLAEAVGVPVEVEPLLGEDGFDPEASLARLRALAGPAGTTAVCSQGGAVPSLVEALAEQAGLAPLESRTRKAATWVLSLHEGALVDVDLRPPPE